MVKYRLNRQNICLYTDVHFNSDMVMYGNGKIIHIGGKKSELGCSVDKSLFL